MSTTEKELIVIIDLYRLLYIHVINQIAFLSQLYQFSDNFVVRHSICDWWLDWITA